MSNDEFRAALENVNLSQLQFAELMGVDGRTVRRWISGQRPVPRTVELMLALWRARPEMVGVVMSLSEELP